MARSHCEHCGATFSSLSGFDTHRIGAFEVRSENGQKIIRPSIRRCLSAEELRARGFLLNDKGIWQSEPAPAGLFDRMFKRGGAQHDD